MSEPLPAVRHDVTLRVALGEYDTGWHQPDGSLGRANICAARAASTGARLVVLPEMCATGFTMEAGRWAQGVDGPIFAKLSRIAEEHDVWLIAGVAMREQTCFQNVAAVFDPRGDLVGSYAKQRVFTFAGEHEHYMPGSTPLVVDIDGVRVSPFVCYDLRFPELFRAAAPWSDLIVVLANWPAVRRAHWDALLPARAIENLAYVAGVNRTGNGGGIQYDGGSAAYDPWGLPAALRMAVASPTIVDVKTDRVASIRAQYPFLDDIQQSASSHTDARHPVYSSGV